MRRAAAVVLMVGLAASALGQPFAETDDEYSLKRHTREDPHQALSFETQLPASPGIFDHRAISSCLPSASPLEVRWAEPSTGVNDQTGIIIGLYGISSTNDCARQFFLFDANWGVDKNAILAVVYYRNQSFQPPYDYGKYQVVDVLRGLGALLEEYPDVDRRRLYLTGGSGGGHVALQVLHFSPGIWAEVHVHKAITRITTPEDYTFNGYEQDPDNVGWNVNLGWPVSQGSFPLETWRRYEAERRLRSPQNAVRVAAIWAQEPDDLHPRVYIGHGTADPTVDFQHFLDLQEALVDFAGMPVEEDGANRWRLGTWRFVQVVGGTHSYQTNQVINANFPDAFTRLRDAEPSLAIDASLPAQNGYTYRIHGDDLQSVELETILQLNAGEAWGVY